MFKTFKAYALRYCAAYKGQFGWNYSGNANLQELHAILNECFMIRRLKKDVLKDLPKKKRQQVFIDADPSMTDELIMKMAQLSGFEAVANRGETSAPDFLRLSQRLC